MSVTAAGRSLEAGLPGRQGRALLAYLVQYRHRGVPRSELIEALWGDDVPAAADNALSALLSKLRRTLGPGVLEGRRELRLTLAGNVLVDAEAGEEAVAASEAALAAGAPERAAALAREALEYIPGPYVPEHDADWVWDRRRELDLVRVRALEALATSEVRQGELGAAEQAALAAVAAAPFRESSYRLLMQVHERAGNQAEALRVFYELRRLLREELGTVPGRATQAVYERALHGDAMPGPAATGLGVAMPWPAALAAHEGRAFVGRSGELDALVGFWSEALQGTRLLALVAGEPGIGKTTLAYELAARVRGDGGAVLYGRCDEEGAASYQPFVEALYGCMTVVDPAHLRERLGSHATELALLLPELDGASSALSDRPGATRSELDARRRRLHDAVAALLDILGTGQPLLVILDDLQWADRSTLALLRHLVRTDSPTRVLFLGTHREETDDDDDLAEIAGDLRRDGVLRRVDVRGLDSDGVGALVSAVGGRDAAPGFVRALHEQTEGNPFFVEEVIRHLRGARIDLGDAVDLEAAGVPAGVREVTTRRLKRLGKPAREALQTAAVVGREFDFAVLDRVNGIRGDQLVRALEEATRARVVREIGGRVGCYMFTHALIRATLSDSVSALRRARLHGRIGEALIELHEPKLEPHLSAIAHHFARAAEAGNPARALDYAVQAGRRADRLLSWEEAAGHYRTALRAHELADGGADRLRCDLLLALGAALARAGDPEAHQIYAAAVECGRGLEDPEVVGRAALGFAGQWNVLGAVQLDVVELLVEGLEALGDADTPLRARLLARLSFELYYSGDPSRRLELSEQAVAIARRTGDVGTLAACLDARHYALWRPENVQERLAVAAELIATAEKIGDRELRLEGLGWNVVDLLELGDIARVDRQIAKARTLAEEVGQPLYLWWTSLFAAMRAQLAGDFEAAERLAQETLEVGQRGQATNATHYFAQQMFNIRREQGRLDEVEDAVRALVIHYSAIPAWRCVLALLEVETGRPEDARATFYGVMGEGVDSLPRDANWLIAVTLAAEVCGALDDAELARELYEALAPYAGRNVVVGRAAACNGSASRLLGILASTLRDWDAAAAHFADAVEMHAAMGARPWTARTRLAEAEMLLRRRRKGDRARARGSLAEAVALAGELGMVAVRERARSLGAGGEIVRPRA